MAVEQITRPIDDVDLKSTATRQITVGLEGKWAVLDVCDANFDKIMTTVGKYFECGRPRGQKPEVIKKVIGSNGEVEADTKSTEDSSGDEQALSAAELRTKVRKWAAENDVEVGDRGKIPQAVLTAFHKANPGLAPKA